MNRNNLKITELSTGGGCGCKVPYRDLEAILANVHDVNNPWVGEDVARIEKSADISLASIDFIQPIVHDEKLFGRIAALHALSDLYAKGGTPRYALMVLCWPRELIGIEGAGRCASGCSLTCQEEGVLLVGGHTIDAQNPIAGLCVIGDEPPRGFVSSSASNSGDEIFITKPLGVGVVSNAIRRGCASPTLEQDFLRTVTKSNRVGIHLATLPISAMTDVTGDGLAGQLSKMSRSGQLNLELDEEMIPILTGARELIADKTLETRLGCQNANIFASTISHLKISCPELLFDPQTNGGLLFSSPRSEADLIQKNLQDLGVNCWRIGRFR